MTERETEIKEQNNETVIIKLRTPVKLILRQMENKFVDDNSNVH